ncbi:MAG: hypothetical protein IPJ64_04310 [Saprospiraceae bacterium]|jgi:hypothetical protein|nr:hypothetical protein [Saprospiraceae bacterium]MBK7795581.1 hypothetical protein [Saprospiraceae bacterium]MBX7163314.1 hypothetical protein [Saprospiraceae bacterium]
MKKILFILFVTFIAVVSKAQDVPPPPPPPPPSPSPAPSIGKEDTLKFKVKDREILIIQKPSMEKSESKIDEKSEPSLADSPDMPMRKENVAPAKKKRSKAASVDFIDFDLGMNFLIHNGDAATKQQAKDLSLKTFRSWSWGFTFLPTKIYLGSKNVLLLTGLTWRFGELEFDKKLNFTPDKTLEYTINETVNGSEIRKSEFDFSHLEVPLTLYLQSKKYRGLGNIGIGLGGYVGVLTHQEHEIKTTNSKRNIETEEDFGFSTFKYGLNAKVDIGAIKFYVNYDLTPTWKETDYHTLECGIWFDL